MRERKGPGDSPGKKKKKKKHSLRHKKGRRDNKRGWISVGLRGGSDPLREPGAEGGHFQLLIEHPEGSPSLSPL